MQTLSFTQITPPELQEMIREGIKQAFNEAQPKEGFDSDERLTRKQVCSLYKISYPTLHKLMKLGNLDYQKIGRKTLFRRQDVENCFNKKG